jgi:hypothetical protein
MAVSVAQAAANALANYLDQSLSDDVTVQARWAEPDVQLPPKVVAVLKVGSRRRLDVVGQAEEARELLPDGKTIRVTRAIGSYEQPLELHVWANNDVDREDMIAQLDQALNAGIPQTLGLNGDPWRDGLLLALLEADRFVGNVEFWFDEPEYFDSAEAVQRREYRAIFVGEARGMFSVIEDVPLLTNPVLELSGDGIAWP